LVLDLSDVTTVGQLKALIERCTGLRATDQAWLSAWAGKYRNAPVDQQADGAFLSTFDLPDPMWVLSRSKNGPPDNAIAPVADATHKAVKAAPAPVDATDSEKRDEIIIMLVGHSKVNTVLV
jgi:hypothetical protein